VQVNNTGKFLAMFVPRIERTLISEDCTSIREMSTLRFREEGSNHAQNFSIAPRGVVKSRCINKGNGSSVEHKWLSDLYNVGTRFEATSNSQVGTAREVNELVVGVKIKAKGSYL